MPTSVLVERGSRGNGRSNVAKAHGCSPDVRMGPLLLSGEGPDGTPGPVAAVYAGAIHLPHALEDLAIGGGHVIEGNGHVGRTARGGNHSLGRMITS